MDMIYSKIIYLTVSAVFVIGMILALVYLKQTKDYTKQISEDVKIIKNNLKTPYE